MRLIHVHVYSYPWYAWNSFLTPWHHNLHIHVSGALWHLVICGTYREKPDCQVLHESHSVVKYHEPHPSKKWKPLQKKNIRANMSAILFHKKCSTKQISWSCSVIVRVRVVLKRTVVGDSDWRFDNLSGSHHHSQVKVLFVECYKSGSWKLIGQFCRAVIGCKTQLAFVSCDWSISICR